MIRAGTLLVLLLGVGACAGSGTPYEVSARAAERAYSSGRYSEAAAHWQRAAEHADGATARDEARYRAAASWDRAGDQARAREAYGALSRGTSERAARARYALAELQLRAGDTERGQAELARFVDELPDSGLAAQAMRRHAAWLAETQGPAAASHYLRGIFRKAGESPLGEQAGFELARVLEQQGQTAEARDQYLTVAGSFPYPRGALWDDCLYRAAELEERLGNPRAAVRHLERLLDERESAFMMGSYERPQYDRAAYRIAELYRDKLGDPGRARLQFQKLANDFPKSRLRDDALWNDALLARRAGETASACAALSTLVADHPDSRFTPCAPLICPTAPRPAGKCRGYIREQLDAGQ